MSLEGKKNNHYRRGKEAKRQKTKIKEKQRKAKGK